MPKPVPTPVNSKYTEMKDKYFQHLYKQANQKADGKVDYLIDQMIEALKGDYDRRGNTPTDDINAQNKLFKEKVRKLNIDTDDALIAMLRQMAVCVMFA